MTATRSPSEITYPSREGAECPYPLFTQWREQAPVHEVPDRPGMFVVSRYEDVRFVARHPELFSSVGSRSRLNPFGNVGEQSMADLVTIETDPPDHKRKRSLSYGTIAPGKLKAKAPMIRGFVDELIDAFIERGSCDLVEEFARPLPIKVMRTLLGLPESDEARIRDFSVLEASGLSWMPQQHQDAQRQRAVAMGEYLTEQVNDRLAHPGGDDVISQIVHGHLERGREPNIDYLRSESGSILVGGIVTTTHLIGMAMLLLIQHPASMETLRRDPRRITRMLEEAIRVESPVQWVPRIATADVELGSTTIPKGSHVLVMWGSANRDTDQFQHPEQFDPTRPNVKDHVGFGYGIHFCLGAPLARLEARISFERLLARLTDIRLSDREDLPHIDSPSFRGLVRLPIEFARA